MKLAAYMTDKGITPEQMAALIGEVSASAVTKWMREERVPRITEQRRIFEVTHRLVAPNDFILLPEQKKASAAA